MQLSETRSKLYSRICCLVLFFVAAAASFNGYYDKWQFREASNSATVYMPNANLGAVLDGTAERPFVYRQLLPAMANKLDHALPASLKTEWLDGKGGLGMRLFREDSLASPLAAQPGEFFRYRAMYLLTFLSAWLAVGAMYLVCMAVGLPRLISVFAPIVMILLLPYLMSIGGYFYDYPELAFLALSFWMAIRFKWWWMLPIVALGTWNKESFLLVIPTLYPLLRSRSKRLPALLQTAVLGSASATVYLALKIKFQHNPGVSMQPQWRTHLQFLLHPVLFFNTVEKTYGITTVRVFTILPVILIVWTVLRGWAWLPVAVRRHAAIAALINFPLYFGFCAAGELRDFSMLYMVFLLLLAVNMVQVMPGMLFGQHEESFMETRQPAREAVA